MKRVQARALGPPCPSAASLDICSPGIKGGKTGKKKDTLLQPQLSHFILRKIRYHLPILEASTRLPPGDQLVKSLP